MGNFEDWLAAMPVEDVRNRIAEIERELELLRVLDRKHRQGVRPSTPSPSVAVPAPADSHPPQKMLRTGRGPRLSPERRAILEVIRRNPDGMAPVEVARALGKAPNPIQTNMSRMVQANMIVRVGTGRYQLPPDDATEGAQQSNGSGLMTLDEPSGRDAEAMEP
jgi:hypothetical protein